MQDIVEKYIMEIIQETNEMPIEKIEEVWEQAKEEVWKGQADTPSYKLVEGVTLYILERKRQQIQTRPRNFVEWALILWRKCRNAKNQTVLRG